MSERLVVDKTATPPKTPVLDRVVGLIAHRAPVSAEGIERLLSKAPKRRRAFRLEGVLNATKLLGRPVPFSLARNVYGRFVYVPSPVRPAPILRAARKQIKTWGMARIDDIVDHLKDPQISPSDVISLLIERHEDFRWLDLRLGWFGLSRYGRVNRVTTRLKKLLAVSSTVSLREAYGGLQKDHRLAGFGPPVKVFTEFCRELPGIRLANGFVSAIDPLDPESLLSPTERKLVGIMERHGVPITFGELRKASLEAGLSISSASVCVSTSPLVRNHSRGVYSLIGRGGRESFRSHPRKYSCPMTSQR